MAAWNMPQCCSQLVPSCAKKGLLYKMVSLTNSLSQIDKETKQNEGHQTNKTSPQSVHLWIGWGPVGAVSTTHISVISLLGHSVWVAVGRWAAVLHVATAALLSIARDADGCAAIGHTVPQRADRPHSSNINTSVGPVLFACTHQGPKE